MNPELYIIGAGGHARVIAAVGISNGFRPRFIWVASQLPPDGAAISEEEFLLNPPTHAHWRIICGFGSVGKMQARSSVLAKYASLSSRFVSIISSSAIIEQSAQIGLGVFVGPGAILGHSSSIGDHSIINTGAIIEHDCHVGVNTHIASGATILGGVSVGNNVLIGGAATILQGITIGSDNVIGASALCIKSIPAGTGTWVGVPARMIKEG